MSHQVDPHATRITIADCEICGGLRDMEASFSKWGWDESTRSLPAVAARLVPAEDTGSYEAEHHHVRRCPVCGTFYQYDWSYEYLANGSEDEELLTRLTPTQARRFLTEQDYQELMAWMAECLAHVQASVRAYAAQSWVAHHLECGELEQVSPYLKLDAEVVAGVLRFLVRESEGRERLARLLPLESGLEELAHQPDGEISGRAAYLLRRLEGLAGPG